MKYVVSFAVPLALLAAAQPALAQATTADVETAPVPPTSPAPAAAEALPSSAAPVSLVVTPTPLRNDKSPGVARALNLGAGIGGLLIGTVTAVAVANLFGDDDRDTSAVALSAGMLVAGVGPSVGHFYAGEYGHGLIVSGVRVAAGTTAMMLAVYDARGAAATAGFLGCIGVALALDVYDLVDAPDAARRANAKARAATGPTVGLVPMPLRAGAGAALVGAF